MRLLLFGCTGFVGRELLPLLLEAGHQLTVVSRRLARGYDAERADGRLIWMQFDPASSSTCLLYTSPSPRDKRQSRMPSSA